jgi:hypothetical protein
MHRGALCLYMAAALTVLFCACRPARPAAGQAQDRFVAFALDHYTDRNGDSIRGQWPDSLPEPTVAFDSLHDEIAGAQYVGSFSILPLNAISFQLYRVDVVSDTALEYFLSAYQCNFSMRNWFEFHFFDATEDEQHPFASTGFSANYLEELSFQNITHRAHPDLLVHWSQRSLAYMNAGVDIFQITRDSVYEIFSQDTLHFDWNYFGKDTLLDWPMMLADDESYRETARLHAFSRDEELLDISNISISRSMQYEAHILQYIVQKEVVQDCDTCAEGDLTQLPSRHLLATDTTRFMYDMERHQYRPAEGTN